MSVSLYFKGARRSSRPDLTVGLETFYHHISLGLILPEVTEKLFLIRIVLANPLQTSLYPTLDAPLGERQPKVEELPVVAVVVEVPASADTFTLGDLGVCHSTLLDDLAACGVQKTQVGVSVAEIQPGRRLLSVFATIHIGPKGPSNACRP